MHSSTVKFVFEVFEPDLTSIVAVELYGSILNIVYDALILVLTWVKTASIRKSFLELGVKTSLTMLLLRDGERALFDVANCLT